MRPLRDLPLPHDSKSMKRVLGLFSYYSQWVPKFSDLIQPLVNTVSFPVQEEGIVAFHKIKDLIEQACVICPTDNEELVLESDASDFAVSACLN